MEKLPCAYSLFLPMLVKLKIYSLSTDNQISIMNTTVGTIIGTVIVRDSIPVRAHAYPRDYVFYHYYHYFYDYYEYYVLHYREVLGDEYGRYILYRQPTLSTEPSNWNGISNMSTVCYDNSTPVISTPLTIHISSLIYTPGPLFVGVDAMSYNPYYYFSKNYKVVITSPDCAPTERFDPVSQKCVSICGCGLINHKLPFCLYFGKPIFSHFMENFIHVILLIQIPATYSHLYIALSTTLCRITAHPFLNYIPALISTEIIGCFHQTSLNSLTLY